MTVSIKSPTSTTGSIQLNGSDVLTIESDRSVDINSGTLHVDAANNRVGIGTSSPTNNLQIYNNGATSGQIHITNSSTGATATDGVLFGYDGSNDVLINNQEATAMKFNNNGSERMRIDSSGRVTMPYQPYFFAQRSTTWTGWVPNNQTQPMLFDNVITNLGNHFNGSTGLFTAPVAGVYQFWSGIYSPSYTQTQHWPVINGSRKTTYVLYPAGSNNITGTFFIKLNANDTAGFHAYDGASSGQVTATAEHTFFYGHLIG